MYLRKSGVCGTLWFPLTHNSKSKKKFGETKKKRDSTKGDEKVDQSYSWNDLIGVEHKSFLNAYGGSTNILTQFVSQHKVKIENKWDVNFVTALPPGTTNVPNGPTVDTVAKKGSASEAKARQVLVQYKSTEESGEALRRNLDVPDDLAVDCRGGGGRGRDGADASDKDDRPSKRRKKSDCGSKDTISKELARALNAVAALSPKDVEAASSSLVGQFATMVRERRKAAGGKCRPPTELQTVAYEVINALQDAHSGFVTLQYKDSMEKSREATYLRVFQPTKREASDLVQQGGFAAIMSKRAKSVKTLISHYDDAYMAEPGKSVIAKVAKDLEYTVFKESEWELAAHEMSHLRDFIGTSTNGIGRLNDFYRATRNVELFPTSYSSLIKEYEEQLALPYKSVMVPLYMSSSDDMGSGKTEPCLFVYSADPCLIAEALTQASIASNTFEESCVFCKLRKRIIFVMGSDRGDGAYSKLIRLANRKGGNTAEHCQIMAHYDRGAECYQNISATVANPDYPIRYFDRQAENDLLHTNIETVAE